MGKTAIIQILQLSPTILNFAYRKRQTMSLNFLVLLALALATISCASYSTTLSSQLVKFSRISYDSAASINSWTCSSYCSSVAVQSPQAFSDSDNILSGFSAFSPSLNAIIIAFRGSNDLVDWIINLTFKQDPFDSCSGCMVHRGFLKVFRGSQQMIKNRILSLKSQYPNKQVIMTGHSQGGALAFLFALDLARYSSAPNLVYTFGQPRVGNTQFANYYQGKVPNTFRVVNYADAVPHTPPRWYSYTHGGHEIWYNPRGMTNYYWCSSENSNCANSVVFWDFSFTDHFISNYEKVRVPQIQAVRSTPTSSTVPELITKVAEAERIIKLIQELKSNR